MISRLLKWLLADKRPDAPKKQLDLTAPAKLRLVKDDHYKDYHLQFWNPVKNAWWYMPDDEVGIHGRWSFEQQGSYGAYDLNIRDIGYEDDPARGLRRMQQEYQTYGDIQKFFDELNADYERCQKDDKAWRRKPGIIQ